MNSAQIPVIAIASGGTGGHIYPALELALTLKKQNTPILWLGQPDSLEMKIAKANDIEFIGCHLKKIRGQSLVQKLVNSFLVLVSIFRCYAKLRRMSIAKIIVFGGFVSFPFAIAALLKGSQLFIHEQNSIAGLTNRILSFFAKQIFIAFKGSFVGKKVVHTGNPVRKSILDLTKDYEQFNPNQSIRILIFGGSLGAKALNETIPSFLSKLALDHPIEIIHQYGNTHKPPLYQNCKSVKTLNYIDDIEKAYEWCDMVICRAGAMSVSEVQAIGVFTLFIPFPHAVNNHQYFNAIQSANDLNRFVLTQEKLNEPSFFAVFNSLLKLKNRENKSLIWEDTQKNKNFFNHTLEPIVHALTSF